MRQNAIYGDPQARINTFRNSIFGRSKWRYKHISKQFFKVHEPEKFSKTKYQIKKRVKGLFMSTWRCQFARQ